MKRLLSALVLTFLSAAAAVAEEVKNPLFEELVSRGIVLPDGPTVKLPDPLLPPGSPPPADTGALLDKAAGRVPVELFRRRTINAPFSLKISSVEKADNERRGQMIDLTFLAYGKLDAVLDTDFMKHFLSGKEKAGAGGNSTILSAKELKERGIRLLDVPGLKDQYATTTLSLLQKVQVEGIMRSVAHEVAARGPVRDSARRSFSERQGAPEYLAAHHTGRRRRKARTAPSLYGSGRLCPRHPVAGAERRSAGRDALPFARTARLVRRTPPPALENVDPDPGQRPLLPTQTGQERDGIKNEPTDEHG